MPDNKARQKDGVEGLIIETSLKGESILNVRPYPWGPRKDKNAFEPVTLEDWKIDYYKAIEIMKKNAPEEAEFNRGISDISLSKHKGTLSWAGCPFSIPQRHSKFCVSVNATDGSVIETVESVELE